MAWLSGNILAIPRTGLECCFLLTALIHIYNFLTYPDTFAMQQILTVKLDMLYQQRTVVMAQKALVS